MSPGIAARAASSLRRFRHDDLLLNSSYLLLTTVTTAALGFLFWLLAARLYTPAQIGAATSLISAISLISYVSLFGLNTAIMRYLPGSADRSADINVGVVVVGVVGLVASVLFVLALPWLAPGLDWLRRSPWTAGAFAVMAALSAVNLFTDSVFISLRAAKFNVLIDGLVQGGAKLMLPAALTWAGSFGLVASSGIASGAAVAASLAVMMALFGYRPTVRVRWQGLRAIASFSVANYVASIFNLVPVVALPLVVLNSVGASGAAYFFMAFQIANLLNAVAYAVTQSLLAEGSYDGVDLAATLRRSVRVLAGSVVPAAGLVAVGGPLIMRIFGTEYSRAGGNALTVLALSAIGVAAYCWVGTVLRFTRQLAALVVMNVVYAVAIVGAALTWARYGLVGVAAAWLLGNVLATVVGGTALLTRRRDVVPVRPRQPGDHGRADGLVLVGGEE